MTSTLLGSQVIHIFWAGLMDVKDLLFQNGRFKVNSGTQTRFWEDIWLGQEPLVDRFPTLYNIVRRKNDTVANVLSMPLLTFLLGEQ